MAKDPAMLWYPSDWIAGTQGMSFEEKGAYMELLMLQFNRGHMTEHMIAHTVGQLWGQIKCKFQQDERGLWYQHRVDEEKEKRRNFVNSRKNNMNGNNQHTKGGKKKRSHDPTYANAVTTHMENENENENENINAIISSFDTEIKDCINQWLAYKKEKKSSYKTTGLIQLLNKIKRQVDTIGKDAVIYAITESMACNYQGIIWDKAVNYSPTQSKLSDTSQPNKRRGWDE